MPFDFEEYETKCSTLSPEALQKEWENYTRHIAGGATSTAGSVLFAPITGGVSLVGLGLSTPRIHNARKKRAIIEAHLQAHGTTHHTRKRDVVGPMVLAGTVGGLTMGFAGAGAELVAGEAAGKGLGEVVSHAVLEVAGATLEHKHDERKRMKDQLELAKKYPSADGPISDQKRSSFLSFPMGSSSSIRKSKSETQLDGLAYGSLPGEKKKAKPVRTHARPSQSGQNASQQSVTPISSGIKPGDCYTTQSNAVRITSATQTQNEEALTSKIVLDNGTKLPYLGLSDHHEVEEGGLQWDPTPCMYMKLGSSSFQSAERFPSPIPDFNPEPDHIGSLSDQSEILSSKILTQSLEFTTLRTTSLVPINESPQLPPRPQTVSLQPRPKSSVGNLPSGTYQSVFPDHNLRIPPPPPLQKSSVKMQVVESIMIQDEIQQHYNSRQYAPSVSTSASLSRVSNQSPEVQSRPDQRYFLPMPSPQYVPVLPVGRPNPQPIQHQYLQGHEEIRQNSISSISTISSEYSSINSNLASPASATSTPSTTYSSSTTPPNLASPPKYDSALYGTPPKRLSPQSFPNPQPMAVATYFPPPPTNDLAGRGEKRNCREYFG